MRGDESDVPSISDSDGDESGDDVSAAFALGELAKYTSTSKSSRKQDVINEEASKAINVGGLGPVPIDRDVTMVDVLRQQRMCVHAMDSFIEYALPNVKAAHLKDVTEAETNVQKMMKDMLVTTHQLEDNLIFKQKSLTSKSPSTSKAPSTTSTKKLTSSTKYTQTTSIAIPATSTIQPKKTSSPLTSKSTSTPPPSKSTTSFSNKTSREIVAKCKAIEEALNAKRMSAPDKATAISNVNDIKRLAITTSVTNVTATPPNVAATSDVIQQMKDLLAPLIKDVSELKAKQSDPTLVTYASKAAPTIPIKERPRHGIIVSGNPNDAEHSADVVRADIRRFVEPAQMNIGINRLQRVSEQKLLIECQTREETSKLKAHLQSEWPTWTIEDVKKKRPKMVIVGVDVNSSRDTFAKDVLAQNENLAALAEGKELSDVIKICFEKRHQNGKFKNVIVELLPSLRHELKKKGDVRIGWHSCRVDDFTAVTTCYKCCGHGHVSKYCPEAKKEDGSDFCLYCAGRHKIQDCPNKKDVTKKQCVNCTRHNAHVSQSEKPYDVKHLSTDVKCSALIKAIRVAESRIDYGHDV